MTLPVRTSLEKALSFFHHKSDWVLTHLANHPSPLPLRDGTTLPLLGTPVTILYQTGRGLTHLNEHALIVHGAVESTPRRVKEFIRKQIFSYSHPRAMEMAERLGRNVRSLRIGDMSARWGSCSPNGALTLNWRLALAPLHVLDYVIAHEVAHLVEMNHSPRFWQRVEELYADYHQAKRWLKQHGQQLYRYQ